MSFKLMLVEDEERIYKPLIEAIEDDIEEHVIVHHFENFSKARDDLVALSPDIVVLDLSDNQKEESFSSKEIWDELWKVKFAPVIFYSGYDVTNHDDVDLNHPFLSSIKKGGTSEEILLKKIEEYLEEIKLLHHVHDEFQGIKQVTLKNLAPEIWKSEKDNEKRKELLVRGARRRFAAALDEELHISGDKLKSWEVYIYPPLGNDLLVADIILDSKKDKLKADAYSVILTPSCDLSTSGERECIENILIANCEEVSEYLKKINLADLPSKEGKIESWKKKLATELTRPHGNSHIALPKFSSIMPHLSVNTKSLGFVSSSDIDPVPGPNSTKRYRRVVSVDSPFREYIIWGYMQVACRPGVPDRDIHDWAEEIKKTLV